MSEAVSITRREWLWAGAGALLVVALTLAPYINAAVNAPEGYVFGGALVSARDGNSYFAKMRQGYAGAWRYRLAFTPEDQEGLFVFTLYLGLGHLARLTGLSPAALFHAARAAGGLALLLALYRLAAELTADVAARRWAFGLAAFASGVGLYALLFGHDASVDLVVPEANNFYSILANPHFPLSFAAAIWALLAVLGQRPDRFWKPVRSGMRWFSVVASGVVLVLLTPLMAPAVWAAVGGGVLALLWQRRTATRAALIKTIARAALLFGVMATMLLGYYLASVRDPAVAAWAAQNVTPSPPVWDYLLGFGVLLPLAIVGIWQLRKEQNPALWVLVSWLAVAAMLVYAPHPLQRRFISGVGVPLTVLAGIGLAGLLVRAGRWLRLALVAIVVLLAAPTNLVVLAALMQAPTQVEAYTYLATDEMTAIDWLAERTTSDSVVLASPELGNFIPAHSSARVVYGHPMETIDAERKESEVRVYFEGQLGSEAAGALFARYAVTHVLFGPRERALQANGAPWLPDSAGLSYEAGGVQIFELARD